jgi:glutathione synthase/RimK-type ligase-like ATP-grasp enzyme
VDLKDMGGKAYVIEVNDNPNVDAGIEDLVLGDELYERIMRSIFNRIEAERHQVRYIY